MARAQDTITLPEIAITGEESLQQLIRQRRSTRKFDDATLGLSEIGQLLWAAQGITSPEGLRTAPSAGALYPLELYLVASRVEGLTPGTYHYGPGTHGLKRTGQGNLLIAVATAAFSQTWIEDAAAVLVFTAVFDRTTGKYGERGVRYVHMEVGGAAQNVYLQAEALELGTTAVGAFNDEEIARLLLLPENTEPLLLMPLGRK